MSARHRSRDHRWQSLLAREPDDRLWLQEHQHILTNIRAQIALDYLVALHFSRYLLIRYYV